MSTGRFAARAGAVAVAALMAFGASDLRADITDQQCADAWAESEASATCTDTTAEVAFGNECSIETTCDKEGYPTPASITRPLEDISELRNCLATLTVGPCDEPPPEDPPEPTPQEQCEEAFASSPASSVCEVREITPQNADYCKVDVDCTEANGQVNRAILHRSLEDVAKLRYCGSGMLSPGLCPGEEPPMADQCADAWEESEASATCTDTTVTAEFEDTECGIETTCDKEGFPTPASITRPLEDISELRNCLATLTVGPCDEDEEEPVSLLEQCTDAWQESAAYQDCPNLFVETENGDTECGIQGSCEAATAGYGYAGITRPVEVIADLTLCNGLLTVGPGQCGEGDEAPLPMTQQCQEAWAANPTSEECTGEYIESTLNHICGLLLSCADNSGTQIPASTVAMLADVPDLQNCNGTLQIAPCVEEGDDPPTEEAACLTEWVKSDASVSCAWDHTEWSESSAVSGGGYCEINVTCWKNDGGLNLQFAASFPLGHVHKLRNCNGVIYELEPGEWCPSWTQ